MLFCYRRHGHNEADEPSATQPLMYQVIRNLIMNAVEYSSVDSGKVSVDLQKKDREILLKVSDNGIGIPKDEQSKVFGKMYRAKNAKDFNAEGTGLGLYLSKMIMQAAGGKMWFESEENKGTTFYVSLSF